MAKGDLVVVDEDGYGKRIWSSGVRRTARGSKGVRIANPSSAGGFVTTYVVKEDDDVLILTDNGLMSRISVEDIPVQGRNTRGVKLMHVAEHDKVVEVRTIPKGD